MEKALIVSSNKTSVNFFTEMLHMASVTDITLAPTCEDAINHTACGEYDYVIINSPLKDSLGHKFAKTTASKGISQVVFVVPNDYYEKLLADTSNIDILMVSKPVNRAMFWSALKLAKSANHRVKKVQDENIKLKKQLQDATVINRAKCILISYLGMSEEEAHKYIEKQAMDVRQTKRIVAEGILKTYEY